MFTVQYVIAGHEYGQTWEMGSPTLDGAMEDYQNLSAQGYTPVIFDNDGFIVSTQAITDFSRKLETVRSIRETLHARINSRVRVANTETLSKQKNGKGYIAIRLRNRVTGANLRAAGSQQEKGNK